MIARGIRNNNPANIRRGSSWKGLSMYQTDSSFCRFMNMDYGIRAFFVLMRTYRYKHQLLSVREILYRFAPVNENYTSSYIRFVCNYIRQNGFPSCSDDGSFRVNIWMNSTTPSEFLRVFARAVFLMETGSEFTDEELELGISLI